MAFNRRIGLQRFRLRLGILKGKGTKFAGLSALREAELGPLADARASLDLSEMDYVSVHAPNSVPQAALRDSELYQFLAPANALRDGRAREQRSLSVILLHRYGRLMANPNLPLLLDAAKLLKLILGELLFVGRCATALLTTDKGATMHPKG